MIRLLKPELFQGNLHKNRYFEGWYHKHVSDDRERAFALIPGISLYGKDPHAFIQYINGVSGETAYIRFDLAAFSWDRKNYGVTIGPNRFSRSGISIDLSHDGLTLSGELAYHDTAAYPFRLASPGIMGWYTWVPFMECYHGVVSMDHTISGALTLNGKGYSFHHGRGYIEKDWGKSFPQTWIWLQCNSFSEAGRSVMFSVAKIPWLGSFFIGFLGFVYEKGTVYLFSTYNGSRIDEVSYKHDELTVSVTSPTHRLVISASPRGTGLLKAPVPSGMDRVIKESISSEVGINLMTAEGKEIIHDRGVRAGLEIIETIFDYFQPGAKKP